MKSIRTYGREITLLALVIAFVAALSQKNIDSVPEVTFEPRHSCGPLDEECRLKMVYVADLLAPIKQSRYHDDIAWLGLESSPHFVYRVGEDKQSYLLTCQDSHHGREGSALRPVSTEKGYGMAEEPLELKAPSTGHVNLSPREFLGLPDFEGSHAVHKMGSFNILVRADPEDGFLMLLPLNPDHDLKSLQERSLLDSLPIARGLSEEARAAIIRKYQVDDPFVLERLEPTWDKHGSLKGSTESESHDKVK